MKPQMHWLDAGCGHEIFKTSLNAEQKLVGRVRLAVGCDVSVAALRNHRSLDRRVCSKLEQLPFAAGTFDLITLNMVAEHLEHPEATFGEFARLLRPDGLLVVHTPNSNSYQVHVIRLVKRILPAAVILRLIKFLDYRDSEDVFPTFYRANTKRRLRRLLNEVQMTEDKVLLLPDIPLSRFFAPLAVFEVVLARFCLCLGWHELFADNILASYRSLKPSDADYGANSRPGRVSGHSLEPRTQKSSGTPLKNLVSSD